MSLVSGLWSLFEVATDVLLFMQSKTTETTSRTLCDPHSADLKMLLIAKFNRGQKDTEGIIYAILSYEARLQNMQSI